jgi:hypothetical protein
VAAGDQAEQMRMDLLTVVMHELGHVIGYPNGGSGVMSETLSTGARLAPSMTPTDSVTRLTNKDRTFDAAVTTLESATDAQPLGIIDQPRALISFVAPELSQTLTIRWNTERIPVDRSNLAVDASTDWPNWDVRSAELLSPRRTALVGDGDFGFELLTDEPLTQL